jgi:hypothetical protein
MCVYLFLLLIRKKGNLPLFWRRDEDGWLCLLSENKIRMMERMVEKMKSFAIESKLVTRCCKPRTQQVLYNIVFLSFF